MVIRISDKTQNYSKVTKLLVKPRVLNYIENPDKTKEELSDGLKEVLAYTTQGYKTNEKEYITGINCEPSTSLKQMMNTKLSYNKMDGRLAYHAVQSFKPGEVTPEECHSLGVQLAKQMWGNRFEVVVSTHLDKDRLNRYIGDLLIYSTLIMSI